MNIDSIHRITSSYVKTNRNFAILNLPQEGEEESELQFIARICDNILNRGFNVNPSAFLRNEFWGSDKIIEPRKLEKFPLISLTVPEWRRDDLRGSVPALDLISNVLPELLGDWAWITGLIRPEVEFSELCNEALDDFIDQSVDFFIPYINVVLEVDGEEFHRNREHNDKRRDDFLRDRKITVKRLSASNSIVNRVY